MDLSTFCESFFLQQMPALLEKDGFRTLLLGSNGALAHSRGDSPLEELEAILAQRLRSLYISSQV